MAIKPIKAEPDYEQALRRVEKLWDSPEGSAESDEMDVLTTLIEAYEREHFPIDLPDPIEAIEFRLEQQGKDFRALVGIIGGRSRVFEVLQGKRRLSLSMIRNLHEKFGIPAEILIRPPQRIRLAARRRAQAGPAREKCHITQYPHFRPGQSIRSAVGTNSVPSEIFSGARFLCPGRFYGTRFSLSPTPPAT